MPNTTRQVARMKQGALRHHFVELCPIGALAMLFACIHILEVPVPNFEPDFTDTEYGEYKQWDWCRLCVLDQRSQRPYDNNRDRICLVHANNSVHIMKGAAWWL